jgi:ParG
MIIAMPKHIPPGAAELSVYIDKELKMQFKLTCVAQNQSMSGVIEELVRQWVKKEQQSGKEKSTNDPDPKPK